VSRRARIERFIVPAGAALVGALWFVAVAGLAPLDPRAIGWTLHGDWSQHMLGALFLRDAPWSLPLGALPNLVHPIGTTAGLTDSNPPLALLAKLFAGQLPDEIQLIGPWLVFCFAAQGWFGARLVAALGARGWHQLMGGALLALSPVLLFRVHHDTLCAHFMLLAMLRLHLEPGQRPLRAVAAWVALSAAVHPYLAAMVLVLGAALLVGQAQAGRLRWRAAAAAIAALVALAATVLWLFGFVALGAPGGWFIGGYDADLLTLVNPAGRSRLLPGAPFDPDSQREGFAYLGLGGLTLVALAAALLWRRRVAVPWARHAPLVAAVALLAGYAVFATWRVLGFPLFDPRAIVRGHVDAIVVGAVALVAAALAARAAARRLGIRRRPWMPAVALAAGALLGLSLALDVNPFRTTGRFIWPLHYLVLVGAVAATVRALPARAAAALLFAACALQVVDIDPDSVARRFDAPGPAEPSTVWASAAGGWRHLVQVPPTLRDGVGFSCGSAERDWVGLARLAHRLRLTYNGGYVARVDPRRARAACAAPAAAIARGELDRDTIYATTDAHARPLRAAGATCGHLDGSVFCVTGDRTGPLPSTLAGAP
jgi:hypothetical protein